MRELLFDSQKYISRKPGLLDRAPRQLLECAYVLLSFLPESRQLRYLLSHIHSPLYAASRPPCVSASWQTSGLFMLQQYAYRCNMGCLRVATLLLRGLYLALSLRDFPGG